MLMGPGRDRCEVILYDGIDRCDGVDRHEMT